MISMNGRANAQPRPALSLVPVQTGQNASARSAYGPKYFAAYMGFALVKLFPGVADGVREMRDHAHGNSSGGGKRKQ